MTTPEGNLSLLVGELLANIQRLIHQEVSLTRSEIEERVEQRTKALKKKTASLVALSAAGLWLAICVTLLLQEWAGLSLAVSFGIVGVTLLLISQIFLSLERNTIEEAPSGIAEGTTAK